MNAPCYRAGFIALVGRPNVGKSTLMNHLLGVKLSIVSKKAQTTRHRIQGVLTRKDAQFVFVDTPGFQTRHRNALNRAMNRVVTHALDDVDVILFVVEAGRFSEDDRRILALLPKGKPVILAINKIDRLPRRDHVLPFIAAMAEHGFAEIVPISAEKDDNLDELLKTIARYLPCQPPLFSEDVLTDRSERFLAAELLREKLFRHLGDEVPYGVAVEVERFEEESGKRRIWATILVAQESHKAIVIGKDGERLKTIARAARVEMERLFDAKVWLSVWVKVKSGWVEDERALKTLGYL
ncbi:MAG: GTPase Era [Rhodocyclaceae bacterium]|nr:GTPase Era [Rhodocyclaceae bacterium]